MGGEEIVGGGCEGWRSEGLYTAGVGGQGLEGLDGGGELVGVDGLCRFLLRFSPDNGKSFGDAYVNGTAIAFLPGKLDC